MAETQDGGPAFPQNLIGAGLSIRDYFAARAMAAYLISTVTAREATDNVDKCATWAYMQADAMLAERAK